MTEPKLIFLQETLVAFQKKISEIFLAISQNNLAPSFSIYRMFLHPPVLIFFCLPCVSSTPILIALFAGIPLGSCPTFASNIKGISANSRGERGK